MHINNSLNTYTVFNLDIHEFVLQHFNIFFLLKVFFQNEFKLYFNKNKSDKQL